MKKIFIIFTLLLTFYLLLNPYPSYAFTNGFNVTSDDELITLVGESGNSYPLTVNLETSDPVLTTYPVGLSLPSISSYSATNSWITFNQSSFNLVNTSTTALNFTVTIPADTETGEYYKAVAVADIPYTDGENSNAPTLLAIPITIQVSKTATPSASTNSSSSSSTTTSTSTTSTTSTTPVTKTTKKYFSKPTKPTITKPADIFSKLAIKKLTTSYSYPNQLTQIKLLLKNEGNISTFPIGSIQVLNQKQNAVKIYPLNTNKTQLKPSQEHLYTYSLNSPKYLVGFFRVTVNLGDQSSQKENLPVKIDRKVFFHLGTYSLFLLLAILVSIITLKNKPKSKKTIILFALLGLAYCYYLSHRPANYKYLGEQVDLSVTSVVKEQVGIRSIINNDLSKTILFTSTNSLGSHLYSLQNETRNSLDQVSQYTYGSFTTNLSYPHSDLPLMMITSGY